MNALGCDVSKWQPGFDFTRAVLAGLSFVFIKATDGLNTDPYFSEHWARAHASGLICGAYHWFQPSVDARQQAEHFLNSVQPQAGDLLAIDLEEKRGANAYRLPAQLQTFITVLGRRPICYTSNGYWNAYLSGALWAVEYPLWIAHYGVAAPLVPLPWAMTRWTFWQFTDRANGPYYGTDPIRSKRIDLDVFNGSVAELQTWISGRS